MMQKKGIYVTYLCTVLRSIGNNLNMPIGCQLCSGFEGGLYRVSSREEAQASLGKRRLCIGHGVAGAKPLGCYLPKSGVEV